jgi:transposase
VDKTFRAYDPHQVFLLPPSIDDWLPEGHLARFVSELVEEVLDLEPFLASYTEARGFPPYDPRLMLKLLIYGYVTGVRSSRAIERRCHDDVAFRFLAANTAPDYRCVARFRRRHLNALSWAIGAGEAPIVTGMTPQLIIDSNGGVSLRASSGEMTWSRVTTMRIGVSSSKLAKANRIRYPASADPSRISLRSSASRTIVSFRYASMSTAVFAHQRATSSCLLASRLTDSPRSSRSRVGFASGSSCDIHPLLQLLQTALTTTSKRLVDRVRDAHAPAGS